MLRRVAAFLLLGVTASLLQAAPEATSDPSKITISAVLDQGDSDLAITSQGLYRATKSDKIWRKLGASPPLTTEARLVANPENAAEILCFTSTDPMFAGREPWATGLYLSNDNAATWRRLKLEGEPIDAYVHSNHSIFVVVYHSTTTPPLGPDVSWSETNGIKYYPSERLLVSRDAGATWADITPHLRSNFGLYGIFQDPDHSDQVCVLSAEMDHTSRAFLYQATNSSYRWTESLAEDWHHGAGIQHYFLNFVPRGGANSSDVPANLDNFFKFSYRPGLNPDLPTRYFMTDHDDYTFHLDHPMLVIVRTVGMFAEPTLKLHDNENERVFWSVRIKPENDVGILTEPDTGRLNVDIPHRDEIIQAYLHDPHLVTHLAGQTHPYQRVVDLDKLYHFTKPGRYQVQLTYTDTFLFHDGSTLGTVAFGVTVLR